MINKINILTVGRIYQALLAEHAQLTDAFNSIVGYWGKAIEQRKTISNRLDEVEAQLRKCDEVLNETQ